MKGKKNSRQISKNNRDLVTLAVRCKLINTE